MGEFFDHTLGRAFRSVPIKLGPKLVAAYAKMTGKTEDEARQELTTEITRTMRSDMDKIAALGRAKTQALFTERRKEREQRSRQGQPLSPREPEEVE